MIRFYMIDRLRIKSQLVDDIIKKGFRNRNPFDRALKRTRVRVVKYGLKVLFGFAAFGAVAEGLIYVLDTELQYSLDSISGDTFKPGKTWRKKWKERVWFLESNSHNPETLLRLTQSRSPVARALGIKALSEPHSWTDEEYSKLARALDARVLVGLARTPNVDSRFFLPQKKLPEPKGYMEDQLCQLLAKLPRDQIDACSLYFTETALREGYNCAQEEREAMWSFSDSPSHSMHCPNAHLDLASYCMHAIESHSTLKSHCVLMIKFGGLQVFQRLYENQHDSIKVCRSIARIIANLAIDSHLHGEIIRTDWLSVLHKWSNSKDLELSQHASRALANLDIDFGGHIKYDDGVYLYHPQKRNNKPWTADAVFVHGLLGGPFVTWRQSDAALKNRDQSKLPEPRGKSTRPKKGESSEKEAEKTLINKAVKGGLDKLNLEEIIKDKRIDVKEVFSKKTAGEQVSSFYWNSICNKVGQESSNERLTLTMRVLCNRVKDILDYHHEKNILNKIRKSKYRRKEHTLCWPQDWLSEDIPNLRILTMEFDSQLSEWSPKCPYESEKRPLTARSLEVLEKLKDAGIGERPVIWLGHSMGGLLVKQMLITAESDPKFQKIAENTKGIVFYSVPHRGTPMAALGAAVNYLFNPSVEIKELEENSKQLLNLQEKFKDFASKRHIKILSFAEGSKTDLPLNIKRIIVSHDSCNIGFGEFHVMDDLDHLNICKPESDRSPVYKLTLKFLKNCIHSASSIQ